jgi:hypothetical protein
MRRALLFCAAIAFAVACGDSVTEPIPDRTLATPPIAFATTTTEDGLTIATDKDDYQPGDTVHFTGLGWQPGDVLDIVLTDDPLTHDPLTWSVNVGEDGMFHDSTYVVDEGDLNVKFTLVATSRATGRALTVTFTDAELVTAELTGTVNDVTVTQGSTANFTISLSATGAIKCVATPASPATAKVHTVFSLSGTGVLSSGTFSALFNFFGGIPISGPNCDITWTGAPTPYSASASVTAAAGTPTGDYTITLSVVAGTVVVTNPGGAGGALADADVTLVKVHVVAPADQTPPKVTINQAVGQADPTNASPINFTVVFDESVNDFATGDVTLSGTANATTAVVTGSGTTYNVAVSGMANDGTVIATIAAAVAHDAAGNGNDASSSTDNTVTYDVTPPKVTINQAATQADPTNASPINFTVVFDESVNDFATGDVTLSGTANATTATVTGSGTTYNVAVSGMTGDGTVIATVAAGKAHDAAGNGNLASTSTDNTVTYDTTPPAISNFTVSPNPVAVNTSFTISATFTDALTNVTGADYSLSGSGGPWAPLPSAVGTAPYGDSKTEQGTITLIQPNADVLNVCVRSTDAALNTNQVAGTNPIQCAFLAVYDPTAGFVTGGGWINSPAGAYVADASVVGKANFGFVSKYITQKDKTTPVLTGNTEFQFQAGSLNFSSTAYDWMVVSGTTKASYKGSGTVNGATGYGFLLSVVDGGSTGDKFRMKIWDKTTSAIVYDNQISAADDATASQLIAGGSIVIHTNGGLATK